MTVYRVQLIGVTWEGRKAAYTYNFPFLPTDTQIRQKAGDFQDVTDYQTVEITRKGDYYDSRTTRKIIDGWQHEDSANLYAEYVG